MKADVAVIGGLGLQLDGRPEEVRTPYGPVQVLPARLQGCDVLFVPRHGEVHLPPHKVNYRGIIWALKELGATRIISANTVGSMSCHPTGSYFLPKDFLEFTHSRPNTFFEDRAVHVDMSIPYCPELRSCLRSSLLSLGEKPLLGQKPQLGREPSLGQELSEGVYVCTEGPHLESPAQIRMLQQFGDVVGMTGYPEVVLAREACLCYASLCLVTNPACGLAGAGDLLASDISEMIRESSERTLEIISRAVELIPQRRSCRCQEALSGAMI
jgi:5'-methylthioadenosine phosphorylase